MRTRIGEALLKKNLFFCSGRIKVAYTSVHLTPRLRATGFITAWRLAIDQHRIMGCLNLFRFVANEYCLLAYKCSAMKALLSLDFKEI